MTTPLVVLIFNRPDTTRRVWEAVRQARPTQLFIVADGPRPDRPGEAARVAAARAVTEAVDWPCQVQRNFSDENLGCRRRVSSGLEWVFGQVESAIILEDDCVPHPTFFPFCEELLSRYRDDERVMAISGDNFQFGQRRAEASYYFSRYPHCWGWATWRRAWHHFDHDLQGWPTARDGGWLRDVLDDSAEVAYWSRIFQDTFDERINSWAYRWTFSCWMQSGLTILPAVNLVSNIGFAADATHTTAASPFDSLPVAPMAFPLVHPRFVVRDAQADARTRRRMFRSPSLPTLARGKLRQLWKAARP